MKFARQTETEFEGVLGTDIEETLKEVFWWYYTGDGKDSEARHIRHLNGIKITFEREG